MKQVRIAAPLMALVMGMGILANAQATSAARTSSFDYEAASGLLIREVVEPDNTQLRLETAYTYDSYGNKVAVTVSSPATGTAAIVPRTSTATYDGRGQFPVGSSNALGQSETFQFDSRFGTPTSLTDSNGLTTQWQYDSFGRKVLEIRADGNQTKWDYLYCNGINGGTTACPALAAYLVQVTPLNASGVSNGAWSKTYFDALDREIRNETPGLDGTVIVQLTEYNNLGRVARKSLPFYSNATPQWATVIYDALGRVTTTVRPDNTQTSVSYNGLTTSTTNALGQTQSTVRNSQGQTVRVTDAAQSALTYLYDPFGNLTKTIDPKGNTVTLSYDVRGRKIQMSDPDMGIWKYDYDALGQLIRQTDAKNQVSTMSYDKLGRMTKRSEPDLVSQWIFDNCTKGVGKLCQSTTDNGYSQVTTYDSLGRATAMTTAIDTSYTASVAYDANGRISRSTYPTGLAVNYVYTSLGYLKEVRNATNNALYWQANTMDAQGHLLQQTYGNNVVTQQVFDAASGRLKNIYAGAGNSVQNLSFSYDSIGNLQSRNDANQNLAETFLYDNLNRLTSATVNSNGAGVVTTSYGYDSIGNMTSRSDVGTYTLGTVNAKPHALAQIALTAGGKRTYAYDSNGNLMTETQYDANNNVIASKGRSASYASFNLPTALSTPSVSLNFIYGPEHQRTKQIAPSAITIYLHPDNEGGLSYEKDIKSDGSVEHKHFITAGDQVIALVKQSNAGTTTRYFHRDYLGSTTAMTDETGSVIERFAYEPFGKRRFLAGNADTNNTIAGVSTDRGFTNHEHLDELGLIHMNGRVYDPAIGRFMSADPTVPEPFNLQSFNRYAYVLNNPLAATDPSGFDCEGIDAGHGDWCEDTYNYSDAGGTSNGPSDSYTFTGATPGPGVTLHQQEQDGGYHYQWATLETGTSANGESTTSMTINTSCCAYPIGQGLDVTANQGLSSNRDFGTQVGGFVDFTLGGVGFVGSLVAGSGTALSGVGMPATPIFALTGTASFDVMQAGWRQMISGEKTSTWLETGLQSIMSERNAALLAMGVGMISPAGEARVGAALATDVAKGAGTAFKDFNQARNAAVEWLETRGFNAEQATLGRLGENAGKPIGMKTADGRVGFRVEYDDRSGAHINVWAGKEKGPHFTFEGNQSMVNQIIKQFIK
jgi:RHS repeat-associated protein